MKYSSASRQITNLELAFNCANLKAALDLAFVHFASHGAKVFYLLHSLSHSFILPAAFCTKAFTFHMFKVSFIMSILTTLWHWKGKNGERNTFLNDLLFFFVRNPSLNQVPVSSCSRSYYWESIYYMPSLSVKSAPRLATGNFHLQLKEAFWPPSLS